MNETLTLITYGIGTLATAFCAYKAHNVGKVVPDVIQLVEDLTGDKMEGSNDEPTPDSLAK